MSGFWYAPDGTPRAGNLPTSGDDSYVGYDGPANELPKGGEGDDTILGLGGNDFIEGNDGRDELYGGADNDVVNGDAGTDYVDGGIGDDVLNGGEGNDTLVGGPAATGLSTDNDLLIGGPGDDRIYGGAGSDTYALYGDIDTYEWTPTVVGGVAGWHVTDDDPSEFGEGSDFVAEDVEYVRYSNFGNEPSYDDIEIPCFLAGTLIATPHGERPIETLRIGDHILTADGRAVTILFAGRTTVEARSARGAQGLPILLRAGALDDGVPHRDLHTSPHHGIVIDGMLVFAQALVNGLSIRRAPAPAAVFVYYNLETEAHEVILANGVPVETFCDNIGREAFDNHAEFDALYPEGREIGEMDLPHAKSARQIPRLTRARLEARAIAATGGLRSAA